MMNTEEAIEFIDEIKTVILEHPIIDEWWKEVHNRRLAEGLVDADTPQKDRMTEEEIDTMLAKVLMGQTDCLRK